MTYYTVRIPKIVIISLLLIALTSGVLAYSITIAQAGVLEDAVNSESAATLAAVTSADYNDIYSFSNEAQSAHGDIMNAAVLLRAGKVPGTDLDLSVEQKTELITVIKRGMVKAQVREKDTLRAAQITQPQVDLIATVRPVESRQLTREIQATANAQATQTSIDLTSTATRTPPTATPVP